MFKSFFRLWWSHLISVGFPQKSLGLTMTPWPEVAASVALVFPSRRTLWLGPSSWNDPRIVHLGALISAGQYHWAMCVYIYIHIYIYRIYDICIIYIYSTCIGGWTVFKSTFSLYIDQPHPACCPENSPAKCGRKHSSPSWTTQSPCRLKCNTWRVQFQLESIVGWWMYNHSYISI